MSKVVFISHATEDQTVAAEVCALLEARGVHCWIAPRDVAAGAQWDDAIVDAIQSSHAFLLILSAHANESPYVKNEVNHAFAGKRLIFTFRIEDVLPGKSLGFYLARHHWIDGFPPPLDEKVDKLGAAISAAEPVSDGAAVATGVVPPQRASRLGKWQSTVARRWRRDRLAWTFAALGVIAAAVAVTVPTMRREAAVADAPETRTEINTPATNDLVSFALSPDGRQIVFVASGDGASRLWLRSLASTTAQPLTGTEGASYPFWSPDNRSVAFFANGRLKRLDIGGGQPQTLANAPTSRGGTWSGDGLIVFAPTNAGPLFRVPAAGGEAVPLTKLGPGQTIHLLPQFLPDGRRFLFRSFGTTEAEGIYIGSLDSAETKRLTASDTVGAYVSPGWLLFVRQTTLVARRFDATRGELMGDPVSVADGVATDFLGRVALSTSMSGLIAYRAGGAAASTRQLTWFDRSGKALGALGAPDANDLREATLSPDGRRAAVSRLVQGNTDVWLVDGARTTRFTHDSSIDQFPSWSPDGTRLVFSSTRKGAYDLYQKPSSGAGTETLLLESPLNKTAQSWTPDGRLLLYSVGDPKTGQDLWVLPMDGDRKPFAFLNSSFHERLGQFSPDGRWVAYQSDESGQYEIYVRPFPGPGGQWQVSTMGGIAPRWRRDGKELFYIASDGKLMAAPVVVNVNNVNRGATLEPGAPVALFSARIAYGGTSPVGIRHQYDVAPDGRFLINVATDDTTTSPITVIQNWRAGLSAPETR